MVSRKLMAMAFTSLIASDVFAREFDWDKFDEVTTSSSCSSLKSQCIDYCRAEATSIAIGNLAQTLGGYRGRQTDSKEFKGQCISDCDESTSSCIERIDALPKKMDFLKKLIYQPGLEFQGTTLIQSKDGQVVMKFDLKDTTVTQAKLRDGQVVINFECEEPRCMKYYGSYRSKFGEATSSTWYSADDGISEYRVESFCKELNSLLHSN